MKAMQAYVPGEQPVDIDTYIKLNTNECPYPPSPKVLDVINSRNNTDLKLYPTPVMSKLCSEMAALYKLKPGQVSAAGGSDEALAYIFMAFFEAGDKVYFPDITYGFYKVYADLFSLNYTEIPLDKDLKINVQDYLNLDGNIFIANPNAPTGIALIPCEIEQILKGNPDRLVVIDEAYVDFSEGKTVIPLIEKYDNLIVVQTFSKSRSLAGMRIGFSFGREELMAGIEKVKFSFNPYNIDRISESVAIEAIRDTAYMRESVEKIKATRSRVSKKLKELGFILTGSETNFLFARHEKISGFDFYARLKSDKILIRHLKGKRTDDYNRITIGTDAEMDKFLEKVEGYLAGV